MRSEGIIIIIVLVIILVFFTKIFEGVEDIQGIWVGKGTNRIPPPEPADITCPEGTIQSGTKCVYTRSEGDEPGCPPGNEPKGVECWESPPAGNSWTTPGGLLYGKTCAPGINDSGITCWYDRGPGIPPTCPPGKVQKGIECYEQPENGWDWTTPGGLLVGKVCPSTTPGGWDDGTTCKYDRGAGTIPICPPGSDQIGFDCYKAPPPGREWTDDTKILAKHGKICPPNTRNNLGNTECLYNRGEGEAFKCHPKADQLGFKCWKKPGEGRVWVDTVLDIRHGEPCPEGTFGTIDGNNCTYSRVGTEKGLICAPGKEQKGLLCYDPPGAGRSWTTPGGLIHGKDCPPGTNDSGTTCWYSRSDRAPDVHPCSKYGEGLRDDGSSCWKDTYGNGIGTIPLKGDCDSGQRDDGTSCWEDLKCTTHCPSWKVWECTTNCSGCGCIKKTLFDRQICPDGQTNVAGLCYNNCKPGYHFVGGNLCEADGGPIVATIGARMHCRDDEEMNLTNTFCLPKPKTLVVGGKEETFGCNRGAICDVSKDLKGAGEPVGLTHCPEGTEGANYIGNLPTICYAKPKDGFECNKGAQCIRSRNTQRGEYAAFDSGLPGDKPENYRGDGFMAYCSDGKHKEGLLCFNDPWKAKDPETGGEWNSACIAGSCGFSKDVKFSTDKTGSIDYCPDGKVNENGLCYHKPLPGYGCTATTCGFNKNIKWGTRTGLVDACPDGYYDKPIGGLCIKKELPPHEGNNYGCFLGICGYSKDIQVGKRSQGYIVKDKDGNPVVEKNSNGDLVQLTSNLTYYCKDGYSLVDGMCVENPKSGFVCDGVNCSAPIASEKLNSYIREVTEEELASFPAPEIPLIL